MILSLELSTHFNQQVLSATVYILSLVHSSLNCVVLQLQLYWMVFVLCMGTCMGVSRGMHDTCGWVGLLFRCEFVDIYLANNFPLQCTSLGYYTLL